MTKKIKSPIPADDNPAKSANNAIAIAWPPESNGNANTKTGDKPAAPLMPKIVDTTNITNVTNNNQKDS